jgi:hypothetical protein
MARFRAGQLWSAAGLAAFVALGTAWVTAQTPSKDDPLKDGVAPALREHLLRHQVLDRNMVLAAPGMVIPFVGTKKDAEALAAEGWVVCDGRQISDPLAAPGFKDTAVPDLRERFLKGSSAAASARAGSDAVPTSTNGRHNHKLPAMWYHRGLNGGHWSGLDTNPGAGGKVENGNPPVQENGDHSHIVKMDPPAYTVFYLVYVRSRAGKP